MDSNSISKRLREIDKELAALYREKRVLEMEQQRYWEKMYAPLVATAEDIENFEEMYYQEDKSGNAVFHNEWCGTLLG